MEEKETKSGIAVVMKDMSHPGSIVEEKFWDLERVHISVNGKRVKTLIDSGTEITVVRKKGIISDYQPEDKPSIFIKGIFDPAKKCILVNVPIGLILRGQM